MTPQPQQAPFTSVVFDIWRPIPSGHYHVQVLELKEVASQAKPNEPFHAWTGEVIDEDSEYIGKRVSWTTSFNITPKSMGYKFYRACGLEELSERSEFKPSDFIGRTCYMKVDLLPTGGKDGGPKNKVVEFLSEEEMQTLAAKASKLMQNVAHKVSPKVTPQPAATATVKAKTVTVHADPPEDKEEPSEEAAESKGDGLTDFPK
jgi:hypothetical protein